MTYSEWQKTSHNVLQLDNANSSLNYLSDELEEQLPLAQVGDDLLG